MDDLKFKGMAFLVKTNKPCHIYSIADNFLFSVIKEQKETGMSLCVVLDERPFPSESYITTNPLRGVEKHNFSHCLSGESAGDYRGWIVDTENIMNAPRDCFRIVFDCDFTSVKEVNQFYGLHRDWVETFNFYKKFNLSIPQLNGQKFFPVYVVFKDQTLTEISYIEYNLK